MPHVAKENIQHVHTALLSELGHVPLSDVWLNECIVHLCSLYPMLVSDRDQLLHHVRAQLLVSDLVQSMDRGSLQFHEYSNAFVQVVGIMDVGVPAQSLYDAWISRETEPSTPLPRGMLRLELSDGFVQQPVVAYEYEPIPNLNLFACLGTKLILHHPIQDRGILLLSPQSVCVLGGTIPELDSHAALAQRICAPLNKDLSAHNILRRDPVTTQQSAQTSDNNSFQSESKFIQGVENKKQANMETILLDDDDDGSDVLLMDAELAIREAERAHVHSPASSLLQKLHDTSKSTQSATPSSSYPEPTSISINHAHDKLFVPNRGTSMSQSSSTYLVSSDVEDAGGPTKTQTYIAISDDSDEA